MAVSTAVDPRAVAWGRPSWRAVRRQQQEAVMLAPPLRARLRAVVPRGTALADPRVLPALAITAVIIATIGLGAGPVRPPGDSPELGLAAAPNPYRTAPGGSRPSGPAATIRSDGAAATAEPTAGVAPSSPAEPTDAPPIPTAIAPSEADPTAPPAAPRRTPAPADQPAASPKPTPASKPKPTPTPAPKPTPAPTPTPAPKPTPAPNPSQGGYVIISRAALMDRPTSGSTWTRLLADAEAKWPAPGSGDQTSKHARFVLAGALVYARTGDAAMRDKVVAALRAVWRGPWYSDMLALARQLSGYVIAADLIDYRERGFMDWLAAARTRVVDDHGRWRTLYFTAGNTAGNYGTYALSSLTAADIYLDDRAGIARDWAIFAGYGKPFASGWSDGPFIKTAGWDQAWSSVQSDGTRRLPIGIDADGKLVEDASRSAGSTLDETGAMYVWESVKAITTSAMLFKRAGYDIRGVTNQQLPRMVGWLRQTRYGVSIDGSLWGYNRYAGAAWARFAMNHLFGTNYPASGPTNGDRTIGYTDWLWP